MHIRKVFIGGGDVSQLKRSLINKFGEIGRNITNLCTSGYFDGYIKEVYFEMEKLPDFTLDKFQKHFEDIVKFSPFAIFVHAEMSEEQIMESINSKLRIFRNYGVNFLAIHGIGRDNLNKILTVIHYLQERFKDAIIEVHQNGNIVRVIVRFPK